MNIRERRRLGLTVPAVFRAARRVAENNNVSGLKDKDLAEAVAAEWMTTEMKATDALMVDWDSIIAFIEKLLPLIMKIIEMFSAI